jgi:hypothetical protein
MTVSLISFGFKHGTPLDVDTLLDVRFLPNPHYDPELRPLTGRDAPVREAVLGSEDCQEFLDIPAISSRSSSPATPQKARPTSPSASAAPVEGTAP